MGMGHPIAVANRARELAQAGWTATQIARRIPTEFPGVEPAPTTVRRWIDREYAERQRSDRRMGGAKTRRWGWRRRLERVRDLRSAGLSYRSVAAVMRLDFRIDLSERQVERLVNEKVGEEAARAALGCPAPTGGEA
jgi:hypothetical protein